LKFPHITVGAISSYGVVNAILDFTAFDKQVATSVGEECANVLRNVTILLETLILDSGLATKVETKHKFQADSLTVDGDFFFFAADVMAESVQYGYQDDLCIPLVNSFNAHGTTDLVDLFANYSINGWNLAYGLGTPYEYGTAYQQDVTTNENKADRQWFFQTCSELAYFQNAPSEGSIRSHMINMTYHRTRCQAVFELDLWPDTDATNEYYGGDHIAATKVFFANGSQDPWQHASVTHTLSDSEPARVIECHNCCHCVDVRTCPGGCDNNDELIHAREIIREHVKEWLEK